MAQLGVPCFCYHGQEYCAPLTVADAAEGGVRVLCPIRHYFFDLTPEERIRQAILRFLTVDSKRANVISQYLRFGVEERSLDVAVVYCGDALDLRFNPNITVLVIETKRLDRALAQEDERQLQSYMIRERCRSGLLFNGRRASWLTLNGPFAHPEWVKESLADFSEIEERLERESNAVHTSITACRKNFTEATSGSFDSLLRLVSIFGEDRSLTFATSIRVKGNLTSVQAFSLRIEGTDLVTYWTRGVGSRYRQRLTRNDFHALLAIRAA